MPMPDEGLLQPVETMRRMLIWEAFNTLRVANEALVRCLLQRDAGLWAYCADVPPRLEGEAMPRELAVGDVRGRQARDLAEERGFRILYREDEHHCGAHRAPGVLACSAPTLEAAEQLNAAKRAFKEAMRPVTERQVRWLRQELSGFARVHLLAAYRQVNLVDGAPLAKVQFSWYRNNASSRRLTVSQARRVVHRAVNRMTGLTASEREDKLESALSVLNRMPDNRTVVQRKPIGPYPIANIFSTSGDRARKTAVTPFLVRATGPTPAINPLDNLAPKSRRKRLSTKRETELISAVAFIYTD